jgi:hypothetical protein
MPTSHARARAAASRPPARSSRFSPRALLAALTSVVVLGSTLIPATAAFAAEPAAVRNTKTANATLVHPGDTFNWMIEVGCSVLKDDCVNATLTDVIPDEFILPDPGDILLTPALNASERTITITGQTVTVAFHQELLRPAGQKGLTNGTVTVTIPVTVRSDLDHTPTPRTVENTSEMVADNAPMLPSTASVQLEVPLELATQPSKSFSPTSNIAVAGLETELTLGGSNTSNAPVTTLTIQDPVDPTVAGNIFRTALTFQSLGAVTWPAGATSATVSLWDATLPTPAWVSADPVAAGGTLILPAAVDPADAGGIRIEFSSGATPEIPRNASASFVLDLENRAGVAIGSYPNVARSTVVRDALEASKTVTASYAVTAATSEVSANKSITPDRMSTVAFGASDLTSGTVTLTGGNAGSIPLTSLTIAEPSAPGDLTSANPLAPAHPGGGLVFDGFTSGVTWPAGATAAAITYFYSDGSSEVLSATAPGLPAANTAKRVTGFSVVFSGHLEQGVSATIPFTIDANPAQTSLSQLYTNQIAVTGIDLYNQNVGPEHASDTVTVLAEQVNLTTSKTLTQTQLRAAPGQSTIATLTTTVAGYPDSTRPLDHIEMLDPPGDTGLTDWYTYFDASQLVFTQVPGNATLTISYRDIDGHYAALATLSTGTQSYDIPANIRDDIYGIKLSWDSTTGFQPGQTLVANLGYSLRDTLRDSTTPLPSAGVVLENCSGSTGTSVAAPDTILSNVAQSDPCPTVTLLETEDGTGSGANLLDKRFINTGNTNDQTLINTRNDNRTRVRLSWSTDGYTGVNQMVIYDGPVDASGNPAPESWSDRGMYDSFNLVSIPQITAALDPLRTYDHVYAELYNKDTHVWEVPSGWCGPTTAACDGNFPARTLNTTQQEQYVAIRFVFTERLVPARTGLSPAAGSGVASSFAHNRNIDLVFQLRNSLRSNAASPVVDGYRYNADLSSGHSVIRNSAWSQATLAVGGPLTDRAADTIELRDPQLAVGVTKTWVGGSLAIPDSTVTVRPTSRVTITATNQTVGKIDSLMIAEPNPTGDAPNDSPFEKFDLLPFQSIAHPTGASGLTVTVTRPNDGDLVATGVPTAVATTVLGWTAAQLADATAVAFVYTGRIDGSSTSTASIVFDLALRETTRTGAAAITAGTVYNSTQAVVADTRWDSSSSITVPTFKDAALGAIAGANIQLVASTIGVATAKTFATTSQVEPTRDPVRLTLEATPSGSERVQSLTITDDRATFWNSFDFIALPTSGDLLTLPTFSPAPGGSGTVIQVEVCLDRTWDALDIADTPDAGCTVSGGHWVGAGVWKTQAQARADFLPTGVTVAQVEGLRVTIQRADGSHWENPQAPTVGIPLMVQRRVDLRTGDPVRTNLAGNAASPGETVPGSTTNGIRADVLGIWGKTAFANNTANYLYQYQNSGVRVHKTPAGVKAPGRLFDYTLSVTNTGNWPIMNPVITDYLPSDGVGAMLIFDPDKPWTYIYALSGSAPSPASGTALPSGTTGPAVAVQADAYGPQKLIFSFPAGSVLEVGQTYVITIPMMFRPGLVNDTVVTNDFSIKGDRGFDSCTAPVGATATYDALTGECSTGTTVRPSEQAALRALMTVKAETDAEYPTDLGFTGAADCDTAVDAAGFSRLPCIPLTLPGQKETWRLTAQNTGTTQMPRLVLSTRLPDVSDTTILDGFVRDSRWQAGFADEITANLGIPGATMTVYYTTATSPCKLVLQTPSNAGACGPDPAIGWAVWSAGALTDPTIVTGLQFVIDFPADHLFKPAEIVTIDITTRTAALSSTPGADTTANNSLSASAISRTGTTDTPVTALDYSVVSVALATGSVQLTKTVTGPAASFLPDGQVFTGNLVCTSLEETVSYPFTLTADTSTVPATVPGVRFDNLPGGASCTVSETTASGQTTYTATTVIVNPLADPTDLPTVELVNDYRFAGITISKTVTTTAPVIPDEYAFTLSCTFLGVAVPLAAVDASFTLNAGDARTVTGIPANSTCVVTETDAKGADATIMTAQTSATHEGASVVVDQAARTATFTRLSPDIVAGVTNTVNADNRFDAPAALIVTKHLAGGGADQFGADKTFLVDILCTFGATTQYDDTVELNAANGWQVVLENIIEGSDCTFTEDGLQGADAVAITPNDGVDTTTGVLVVPGPTDDEPSPIVDIDVTNWYLTGSVEVTKTFAGDDGAIDKFAMAPVPAVEFEFELSCVRNGEDVIIPGGGTRTVTALSPVADYTGLASGAECTIAETRAGGASLTRILDADGDELPGGVFTVTVDDTVLSATDQVQPEIRIENTYRFADVSAAKIVVDASNGRGLGPFELTLQCTLDGRDIEAAEPAVASIRGGETATWTGLAEGAECTIEETNTGGATRTTTALTGADGTLGSAVEGISVELEPLRWTGDTAPNHVEFTNSFRLAYTGSSFDFPSLLLLPLGLLLGGALLVGFRTSRRRTEARTAHSH